jgi:translation initiation factor RLI1
LKLSDSLLPRHTQPADIYLIDEPSAYLNEEEISVAAKVIKNYILYAKKTAFVVETNPSVGLAIYDKVIIFDGEPASDIIATPPANHFIVRFFFPSLFICMFFFFGDMWWY